MQLHLTAKRLDITPNVEETLTRHLDRLRPRLRHFAPDLVHLDLALRRHPRKQEYSGSIRLRVAGTLLPSRLNRAVAGDRDAFDRLVDEDLPSVRRGILEAIIERGQDPRPEMVEQVLGDDLTVAARQVTRKPPQWSMNGWLTRRTNALPVTQSAQIRS